MKQLKDLLSMTHVLAGLCGMLLAAGIAWGTGAQKIKDQDRRITKVEAEVREDVQTLRQDIQNLRKENGDNFKELMKELRKERR